MSTNKMQYVRLGTSGLKVSKIILGCMSYGSPEWQDWVLGEEEAIKHIKFAYDHGITTFDTANIYSNGLSEVVLGKAIKQFNLPREELVIMTKLYFARPKGPDAEALHSVVPARPRHAHAPTEHGDAALQDRRVPADLQHTCYPRHRRVEEPELSKKKGASMAQIATAWILAKPGVTAPVIGTTSLKNLEDIIGALEVELTEDDIKFLEEPYTPVAIVGHS